VPVIANIRPSGDTYLMEDFYYAGGLLGLLSRLKPFLDLGQITAAGETWARASRREVYNDDVIRTARQPIYKEGALAVLRGNIAPDGCVIKPSAAARSSSAHRPGAGLRRLRRDEGGHRPRRPRRHRRHGAGAAQRRPARRAGHAGMGHAADPEESW
jgi:hypothetical protein